jgi:hypothetical protein
MLGRDVDIAHPPLQRRTRVDRRAAAKREARIDGVDAGGGYSSDTRPSSTAALIKAWGSVTPSEAIATIRWAILAFIAGVGREWSIRLTAMSSADLIVVSNSGLKLASVTIGIYSSS